MGSDFKKQNCLYHTCGLVIANLHTFYDFHDENKENVKNHTLFSSTCPPPPPAPTHSIGTATRGSSTKTWNPESGNGITETEMETEYRIKYQ